MNCSIHERIADRLRRNLFAVELHFPWSGKSKSVEQFDLSGGKADLHFKVAWVNDSNMSCTHFTVESILFSCFWLGILFVVFRLGVVVNQRYALDGRCAGGTWARQDDFTRRISCRTASDNFSAWLIAMTHRFFHYCVRSRTNLTEPSEIVYFAETTFTHFRGFVSFLNLKNRVNCVSTRYALTEKYQHHTSLTRISTHRKIFSLKIVRLLGPGHDFSPNISFRWLPTMPHSRHCCNKLKSRFFSILFFKFSRTRSNAVL